MIPLTDENGLVLESEKMDCEGCRWYDAYLDTCTEDLDEEYPDCFDPIISAINQGRRST